MIEIEIRVCFYGCEKIAVALHECKVFSVACALFLVACALFLVAPNRQKITKNKLIFSDHVNSH
jgi:hypothetical protein